MDKELLMVDRGTDGIRRYRIEYVREMVGECEIEKISVQNGEIEIKKRKMCRGLSLLYKMILHDIYIYTWMDRKLISCIDKEEKGKKGERRERGSSDLE